MKLLILRLSLLVFLLSCQQLAFPIACAANQINNLDKLFYGKSENPSRAEPLSDIDSGVKSFSPIYIGPQDGQMEADKIDALPGQPEGVNFNQYAGYVTVDEQAGRALFYYFVESPDNSSGKPLLLWLGSDQSCSSFGYGAMTELGPFRVNNDNKTLHLNEYAWNAVANVIFLDAPAPVGFSYSNRSDDYMHLNDQNTTEDSYTFLVSWFERFPQYKNREFYLAGELYAGHYAPQLASMILDRNQKPNATLINLKGIAIGNPYLDSLLMHKGQFDFLWSHGLCSDENYANITKYCDFTTGNFSDPSCINAMVNATGGTGPINNFNVYAPSCIPPVPGPPNSVKELDPCVELRAVLYLDITEVQQAFHVRTTNFYDFCRQIVFQAGPNTTLPSIKQLMTTGIRIWLYSGDLDSVVPVTTTRYCINSLNLPTETYWRPWYTNGEVGGYVTGYRGLVFVTVKGAGSRAPRDQPGPALTMISSFLKGNLPPDLGSQWKVAGIKKTM